MINNNPMRRTHKTTFFSMLFVIPLSVVLLLVAFAISSQNIVVTTQVAYSQTQLSEIDRLLVEADSFFFQGNNSQALILYD